jgi:recombination protein RecT
MSNNALTKTDNEAGAFLQKFGKSLEQYAIRKYDKSTFLKSAMLAIVSNDNLAECLKTEQGKLSIFNSLRYASVTGLSLNPQEGKACLIAYNGQVSYQIMKNGMTELALETGQIQSIRSEYIKVNDTFKTKITANGDYYEFEPADTDRGGIRGFFAAIRFKDGYTTIKYMTKDEVEEIRDKYGKFVYDKKTGEKIKNSAWNKSFIGMGQKTVLKALLRSLEISDDFDKMITSEDFYEVDFTVEPEPGTSADEAAEKLKDKKEQPKQATPEQQGDLL